MIPLLLTALAYVLGATPSSYWMGKLVYGIDLRTQGSGNLGATNVFRVFGARAAIPVLVLDVAKGWAPVAIFPFFVPQVSLGWRLAFGAAAILGHVFSFWVGFRGGKGVATSAGVFLALAPLALVVAAVVWTVTVLGTGYVSLGSMLAAVALPFAVALTAPAGGAILMAFASGLAVFVIWKHRPNIHRLLRGEEKRIRRSTPREEASS